jgi:hypothetical protein
MKKRKLKTKKRKEKKREGKYQIRSFRRMLFFDLLYCIFVPAIRDDFE